MINYIGRIEWPTCAIAKVLFPPCDAINLDYKSRMIHCIAVIARLVFSIQSSWQSVL